MKTSNPIKLSEEQGEEDNPFLTNMWQDKDIEFMDTLEGEKRDGFLNLGAYFFEKKRRN